MKRNLSNTDRIIRIIGAIAIAAVLFTGVVAIKTTLGIILAVAGVIFAFTSAVNWCAIYQLFGISTCPVESKQA